MMSQVPNDLRYTKDHEWARLEGGLAVVGITDYAQHELGDIVFVQLPEVGSLAIKGEPFGEIEAVKTVAALNAPMSGKVAEVNTALADKADTINTDPYGAGWIIKIKPSSPTEADDLLTADAYKELL
ncbi:MAG: glycine cleavage system protein GcvH [Fibrobacterota bacterium]